MQALRSGGVAWSGGPGSDPFVRRGKSHPHVATSGVAVETPRSDEDSQGGEPFDARPAVLVTGCPQYKPGLQDPRP